MANKRKAAKLLRKAAELIEDYGHVKGFAGDKRHGFCAVGALAEAEVSCNAFYVDYELAAKAVAVTQNLKKRFGTRYLPEWNDSYKTSKTDVISAFRKTAKALEHGLRVSV